eukprot:6176130-Pleurochrysis_carterae.AAC.4
MPALCAGTTLSSRQLESSHLAKDGPVDAKPKMHGAAQLYANADRVSPACYDNRLLKSGLTG